MVIQLSPRVRADVVYGTLLAFRPWWGLRNNLLICDPSKMDEERRQRPYSTVGSSTDGIA